MTEIQMTHLMGLNGIGLAIAAWLWSYGGRAGTAKAWRRFGSTGVICLFLSLTFILRGLWSWWLLGIYPCLMTASMGYTDFWRRVYFALANCLVGLFLCLVFGSSAWMLLILHIFVAFMTVYFAAKNPIYAPAEEWLVCVLLYCVLLTYPFIV